MFLNPCCKINLGLYVVEKRSDGYHNLETVFYPIPLCDNLEVKTLHHSNEPYLLQTVGPKIQGDPEDNLIIKVYNQLKSDFELPQLDILLHKKIPTGAGLGGGSSDAAFMMRILNEEYQLGMDNSEMRKRISKLGADCAFFIDPHPTYAMGIGDIFSPITLSLKKWVLVLVKPQTSVSTQKAYSQIVPKKPSVDLREALALPVEEWKNVVYNDFEKSVFSTHPEIEAIKETLYDMGACFALMSGSGSTVFALFKKKQDDLRKIFSDCFTFQSTLLQ